MDKKQKIILVRIAASSVLLALYFILNINISAKIALCVAAYLIVGGDILWRAVRNIFRGEVFDENFLMALATVGALAIGEYPEAVAVMLFYQIGELCQDIAVERSRASISSLMDIRPDYANVEIDGNIKQVAPDSVCVGSEIVIKAGEKIPLDGVIVEGESSLNTTALTGESMPRDVRKGDNVISGCLNMTGLLRVRTTSTFGESTVAKILNLVENSENKKAEAEKFITRFAKYYTPIVVLAAVLLAVVPPLITGGAWAEWLNRALIFLVISCPCALVISIPLTFFAGIGGASRRGVLVKGANYLEALAKAEIIVFDKTGTLTKGAFVVTAVHPEIINENTLLELAAMAECYSTHPISASLRNAYKKDIDKSRISSVEEIAGHGIKAVIDGKTLYVGNSKLMEQIGVAWKPCERHGTLVHIAQSSEYLGHIVISDEIKPQSAEAIAALKKLGVSKTVMLTGDKKEVGEEVARTLGVDEVHTELLPADKVEQMEHLALAKTANGTLAFVGDGINDAPVLKRADVGIAMGALGSDAAIEAADVVLMDDNPLKIATAIGISRKTLRIVRQNIVFAIGIKLLILLLGAFGMANMWEAVFADVGVSLLAIMNALRAMRK